MNRVSTRLIARFLCFLILQVLVFNQWILFGSIFPCVYIFFILSYPFEANPQEVTLVGFLLGLSLDLLTQSPGAHTIATLSIAALRPAVIAISLGLITDFSSIFSRRIKNLNLFYFITILTWTHQLIYFTVLYFSGEAWLQILTRSLVQFIVSGLFIFLVLNLYSRDDS